MKWQWRWIGFGQQFTIFLLMLISLSMLSISGCANISGSGSATPTVQHPTEPIATPIAQNVTGSTATPAIQNIIGGTLTPAAIKSTDNGQLTKVGQLVNNNNLHAYMYRVSESMNGVNKSFEIGITYSDARYKGVDTKLTTVTQYMQASNGTYIAGTPIYVYTSKMNGDVLGGTNKVIINGQPVDQDMSINDATNTISQDIVYNAILNGDIPVMYIGPETINVDGKTYDCTKYSMSIGNTNEIEWYTPQAPIPVKSLWAPIDNYTQVTELICWN